MKHVLAKFSAGRSIWILFGFALIVYSVFVLLISPLLVHSVNPSGQLKNFYIIQRLLIGVLFFLAIINIFQIQSNKAWLTWIFFIGIIVRLLLLPSQPIIEDDYYRYFWDGKVVANGFNPYVYSPKEILEKNEFVPKNLLILADQSKEILENVNNPGLKSLYPPLSQVFFAASYLIYPNSIYVLKLFYLIGDLILLLLLFKLLEHFKMSSVFLSIYWLNPIVLHEFYNASHFDLFVLIFLAASILQLVRNKNTLAFVFLALAVGFRLWPIILLPFYINYLWPNKKNILKNSFLFLVICSLFYAPVFYDVFSFDSGFMKFAGNWENNAAIYEILKYLMQTINDLFALGIGCAHCVVRWIIIIAMAFIIFYMIRRKIENQADMLERITIISLIMFLIIPTQFPWYYTWILPLLVIRPKISFLIYPALLPLYQFKSIGIYAVLIQHLPVLLIFLYELKKGSLLTPFKFTAIPKNEYLS